MKKPPKIKLTGDKILAKKYIRSALKQLDILQKINKKSLSQKGPFTKDLDKNVRCMVEEKFGQPFVDIVADKLPEKKADKSPTIPEPTIEEPLCSMDNPSAVMIIIPGSPYIIHTVNLSDGSTDEVPLDTCPAPS